MPLAQLLDGSPAAPASAAVNGLLDCQGSPEEAAAEAAALLQRQPFASLKVKVGRRGDPAADAAALLAIRAAVGPAVALRADANRAWSLPEALAFGVAAAPAGLEYIEEPTSRPGDAAELHRRTGIPLALDESVDEGERGPERMQHASPPGSASDALGMCFCSCSLIPVCLPAHLPPFPFAGLVGPHALDAERYSEGVAALVLKPSVLGGFERCAELAAWAAARGMRAVVSSAFETSHGTAQLAQLAAALDASLAAPAGSGSRSATAHGLATLSWFAEDLVPLEGGVAQRLLRPDPATGRMTISVAAAEQVAGLGTALALGLSQAASGAAAQPSEPYVRRRRSVHTAAGSYDWSLLEALPPAAAAAGSNGGNGSSPAQPEQPPVLLLHGFLGAADDWRPLMAALGLRRRCVALDLPGHGSTTVSSEAAFSLEAAAQAVAALVEAEGLQGCQLVGYSLGARLALLLAARWPHLFSSVASVSGEPTRACGSWQLAMHELRTGRACASTTRLLA